MIRMEWKFGLVVLCALVLVARAQLIADDSLRLTVTAINSASSLGDLRIRPDADTFKLYWFDNNQKVFIEGPSIRNLSNALNGLDDIRFDVVDLDSNPLILASYNKNGEGGFFYIKMGQGPSFSSSLKCSMVNIPLKAVVHQSEVFAGFTVDCPAGSYSKYFAQISFGGGIVSTTTWNATAFTSGTVTNDVALLDDKGQTFSVWSNDGLNIVAGTINVLPIIQNGAVQTVLPHSCNSPTVVDSTLFCLKSSLEIILAPLNSTGVAISERSLGVYGTGLTGHVMRGSRQNITVIGYTNKDIVCLHLKSLQYPLYTRPICWRETYSEIISLAVTSLTNNSIVVAYFALGTAPSVIRTQMINMVCGDGFLGPNEECDSVANCRADCRCAVGFNFDPSSNNCIFDQSAPMPSNPEVVPLLDCFVPLNDTHVRGYFSYDNLQNQSVLVTIGDNNYFTKIGSDVGQPTVFSSGHLSFFPASAFAVTWRKQQIEWHLTGNVLSVDPATSAQLCPNDVTLEVNVIVSRVPNATELAQIAASIASYLGVDPSRVHIDVQYDGTNVVLVITIIGDGSVISSTLIAEKLLDAIKNDSEGLEEKVKEIIPIVINEGTVRGQKTIQYGTIPPVAVPSQSTFVSIQFVLLIAAIISLML